LVAVAFSITSNCVHLRRALELGATPEEIAELLGITVLLNGGPSDVWTREAIADELAKARR
jgi:alkylhydroperoxidase/carboxymuconolactone decarboxylase family protein YurZ